MVLSGCGLQHKCCVWNVRILRFARCTNLRLCASQARQFGTKRPRVLQFNNRGVAQFGSALGSGLDHHTRRIIFEKSRKPLKTLTFSALPNVEKSLIPRSDHMFDHLQKNQIFLPHRGVAKVVSRIVRDDEIAGSSPVTSTKNSQKQAILTCFRLFFYLFFTKSAIFG